jgi:hypothetical protein
MKVGFGEVGTVELEAAAAGRDARREGRAGRPGSSRGVAGPQPYSTPPDGTTRGRGSYRNVLLSPDYEPRFVSPRTPRSARSRAWATRLQSWCSQT